jgi:hypothetical protein
MKVAGLQRVFERALGKARRLRSVAKPHRVLSNLVKHKRKLCVVPRLFQDWDCLSSKRHDLSD